MSLYRLAADIGGTNCRIGVATTNGIRNALSWPTATLSSLEELLSLYQRQTGVVAQSFAAGVAAPVDSGCATLTNANFEANVNQLGIPAILLNDLEAAAYGAAALITRQDEQVSMLWSSCEQSSPKATRLETLIGLGTGHGQAHIVWNGDDVHSIFPTESGHAEFAPSTKELEHFSKFFLSKHSTRVRVEDVVSGMGLEHLLEFATQKFPMQRLGSDAAGVSIAKAPEHPASVMVCRLFLDALGSVIGDSILRLRTNNLWICGGVAVKLRHWLGDPRLRAATRSKSPMEHVIDAASVGLILNEDVGLIGAASLSLKL